MSKINRNQLAEKIFKFLPITLLFISVLNDLDFNNTVESAPTELVSISNIGENTDISKNEFTQE